MAEEKEKHIQTISEEATHRSQICDAMCQRAGQVGEELEAGLRLVGGITKSVSFFGSARTKEDDEHYQQAMRLAGRLSEAGFAVVTGGGPGIMEGANRGAHDAGGDSIGLNIELPFEQSINPYVTNSFDFHYFFTRKVALAFAAEAYLYFPGGFGTLDEFFEIITLIQTKKVPHAPVILIGKDYWEPLHTVIQKTLFEEHATISKEDMDLYVITDDEDEVVEMVKNAPIQEEE